MGQSQTRRYELGMENYHGENYKTAVYYFQKNSEHAESLYMMGECYMAGHGIDCDRQRALDHYFKSYNLGYIPAAKRIAEIHNGSGNYKDAFEYYSVYYKKFDDPYVCLTLGEMAFYGIGTETNYKMAFELFTKLYSKRLASNKVLYNLGTMHVEGLGTEKNKQEGIKILTIAHNNFYNDATLYLQKLMGHYSENQ